MRVWPVAARAPSGKMTSGMPDSRAVTPRMQAGDGCARTAGMIDGHLAGAVEIPADEGNLPERLLGEDAELEGKFGEEDRGVDVTEVVGGVDGDLMESELFGDR